MTPTVSWPAGRLQALSARACAVAFVIGLAAALLTLPAQATERPQAASEAQKTGASEAAAAPARYAPADLARAFGFMDSNGDGTVSRQEASSFRGVAKNFDRADTDQDGRLSRAEFDTAMNHVKSK